MKICWFGIYRPDFGRNEVYMSGLRENGVEIIECRDDSAGLKKYWRLWKKHRLIRDSYDVMVVGYPGHLVTPLAKIISSKPVVLDALCTLYEGEVISRGLYRFNPLMRAWIIFVDFLAAKCADLIFVETEAQKKYFMKRFSLSDRKVARVFTGACEKVFHPDPTVQKHSVFTVVFRGRFLPEAGVSHVIRAAKLLEDKGVDFLIIGDGLMAGEAASLIAELKPRNLQWIREYIPTDELRRKMLECHASIGQMERHQRLDRTIPHKAFESLSMELPYITGRAVGISELLTDGVDCLMVNPADPEDLAAKILQSKDNPELREMLTKNGRELYERLLDPARLARDIVATIASIGLK